MLQLSLSEEQSRLMTAALLVISAAVVGAVLHYTAVVAVPFVLAVFLTALVAPLCDVLELRFRIPHAVAVTVTVLLVVALFLVLGLLLTKMVQTVLESAGVYNRGLGSFVDETVKPLASWGIHVNAERIKSELDATVPALIRQSAGTVLSYASQATLCLIFVIFLLLGRNPRVIRKGFLAEIDSRVRRYLTIKVLISAVTGLLVWLTLWLLDLRFAGLFGLLAFLLNFIPTVGSILATLLPIPMAVSQFDDPWKIVGVVAIPTLIQLVIGNGIDPALMGQGMRLHPVTVIFALVVWGIVWGPVGMILAVPITAVIRLVLLEFETTRPMASLLAGEVDFDWGSGTKDEEVIVEDACRSAKA